MIQEAARGGGVVLESTGNALAIANVLRAHALEVVVANPMQVRAISHAKVKNDRVDARTLAELPAADLLPRCGPPTSPRGRCDG